MCGKVIGGHQPLQVNDDCDCQATTALRTVVGARASSLRNGPHCNAAAGMSNDWPGGAGVPTVAPMLGGVDE